MFLTRFKKRSKPDMAENTPSQNSVCKNCNTLFKGNYCPQCGQSTKEVDRPFSLIFYDFLGNLFAFDTRFLKTFVHLMIRPGFLTREFFEGRRIRYATPFRFYIFVSFILFLLLQIHTNRQLNGFLNHSFTDVRDLKGGGSEAIVLADSIEAALQDAPEGQAIQQLMEDETGTNQILPLNPDSIRKAPDIRSAFHLLAAELEKQWRTETDPARKIRLLGFIRLLRSPEQVVARCLKYMSWAFFLLLPVFALILWLFYFRNNQYYIRHLIFSIHIHSFVFVILILITLLDLLFKGPPGWISAIFLLSVPLYILLALKNFYGQGTGKVILKFFGIGLVYSIFFWLAAGLVIINTLNII